MGTQNSDPSSSIALLQERFKQLQRVKELRERREMQRVLSEGERPSSSAYCEKQNWLFHPDLYRPPMPAQNPQLRRIHDRGDHVEFHAASLLPTSLWPNRSTAQNTISGSETDVDTSLHL